MLTEHTQAPRDCFRVYHEKRFCTSDFSIASDADIDSNDSDDNLDKDSEKSVNCKCTCNGNLKIAEV